MYSEIVTDVCLRRRPGTYRLVKNLAAPTTNAELDVFAKVLVELCNHFSNKTLIAIKQLLKLEFEETATGLQGAFMRGQSLTTKIQSDYCRILLLLVIDLNLTE